MPQTLTIRGVEPSDLPSVAALARLLAASVEDPDPGLGTADLFALSLGADPWFECLVALQDGLVVGFASFCKRFELHTRERVLWIGDLVSTPDRRGQGIGTALLNAVKSRGRALGCASILLEVWRKNHRARSLYARLGAEVLDDRDLVVFALEPGGRQSS